VEVAVGPGGGGGGTAELLPPQPMIKLIAKSKPNPNDTRKSLCLYAQRTEKRAARPLRRLRGHSGFGPKGKGKTLRLDARVLCTRVAPEAGESVRIAVEVAPLARFAADGCNEQE